MIHILLKYEISEMGILKVILQRMNRENFYESGRTDGECSRGYDVPS